MQTASYILGGLLILSALGILFAKKPIYAALSFLATLMLLAAQYLMLSAEFIAVMQILVYAGAILVLFIFVMMLFQESYLEILKVPSKSSRLLIGVVSVSFLAVIGFVMSKISDIETTKKALPEGFGQAKALGYALYIDFFFPFEAVLLLFLVGIVGSVFIAQKEK